MKQTKAEKLAALTPLLERLEQLEAGIKKKAQVHGVANHAIYDSGSSLLIGSMKKQSLKSFSQEMKDTKLTRAARNLTISMHDDVGIMIADMASRIPTRLNAINPTSGLTPYTNLIVPTILGAVNDSVIAFQDNYIDVLSDIFNQGRFHQTLYNTKIKSLARFSGISNDYTFKNATKTACIEEFDTAMQVVMTDLCSTASSLVAEGTSRPDLNNALEEETQSRLALFRGMIKSHALQMYTAGNLFQLNLDNVAEVRWHLGNPLTECGNCRALQMGDLVLNIPHKREMFDSIVYDFKSIWATANEKGARFFNHDDCTCAFVPKVIS
jgi:hypothetical protein